MPHFPTELTIAPRLFATVFGVIFLAELPDKTALAAMVLATRHRALPVFLGAALALTAQSIIAVAAGALLAKLPEKIVHIGSGLVFIGCALVMWLRKPDADDESADGRPQAGFWRALWTVFAVVFIAEWGDLDADRHRRLRSQASRLAHDLRRLVAGVVVCRRPRCLRRQPCGQAARPAPDAKGGGRRLPRRGRAVDGRRRLSRGRVKFRSRLRSLSFLLGFGLAASCADSSTSGDGSAAVADLATTTPAYDFGGHCNSAVGDGGACLPSGSSCCQSSDCCHGICAFPLISPREPLGGDGVCE